VLFNRGVAFFPAFVPRHLSARLEYGPWLRVSFDLGLETIRPSDERRALTTRADDR